MRNDYATDKLSFHSVIQKNRKKQVILLWRRRRVSCNIVYVCVRVLQFNKYRSTR